MQGPRRWRPIRAERSSDFSPGGWRRGSAGRSAPPPDPFAPLLSILLREGIHREATDEQRYDAAIALHELGTAEALRRLDERPGHEDGRAVLRDARWDAPDAGPVPLLGVPGGWRAVTALVARRCRQGLALASARWAAAALGAAAAGTLAGLSGGLALRFVPGSDTDAPVALTLAIVGAVAGALGGAGVGTGLAAAEAVARSARAVALAIGGALTGLLTGWLAHYAARAVLTGVFGRDIPGMGGPLEGLVLGAATGIGYAIATRRLPQGGMATPRGRARWRVAALTGLATAIGAVALALAGRHLVGSSLDLMAGAFAGSQVGLDPLARLLGEERLRPVTRMVINGFEGVLFGSGIAFGLTIRPRQSAHMIVREETPRSHEGSGRQDVSQRTGRSPAAGETGHGREDDQSNASGERPEGEQHRTGPRVVPGRGIAREEPREDVGVRDQRGQAEQRFAAAQPQDE